MSTTERAYEDAKWRGLKNLQSILSNRRLDDHHYGYSSAHYNKFASLSDLFSLSLIVLENIDRAQMSGPNIGPEEFAQIAQKLCNEVDCLVRELREQGDMLCDLGSQLDRTMRRWVERNMNELTSHGRAKHES